VPGADITSSDSITSLAMPGIAPRSTTTAAVATTAHARAVAVNLPAAVRRQTGISPGPRGSGRYGRLAVRHSYEDEDSEACDNEVGDSVHFSKRRDPSSEQRTPDQEPAHPGVLSHLGVRAAIGKRGSPTCDANRSGVTRRLSTNALLSLVAETRRAVPSICPSRTREPCGGRIARPKPMEATR
jgi:hypothetical protein